MINDLCSLRLFWLLFGGLLIMGCVDQLRTCPPRDYPISAAPSSKKQNPWECPVKASSASSKGQGWRDGFSVRPDQAADIRSQRLSMPVTERPGQE